jgi:hypothetical protein
MAVKHCKRAIPGRALQVRGAFARRRRKPSSLRTEQHRIHCPTARAQLHHFFCTNDAPDPRRSVDRSSDNPLAVGAERGTKNRPFVSAEKSLLSYQV